MRILKNFLFHYLCKLNIWKNNEILYGFYKQSSIFQPYNPHPLERKDGKRRTIGYIPERKRTLRLALGNKDFHICFL